MAPSEIHALEPVNGPSCGKEDSANGIKLRSLRWRRITWISQVRPTELQVSLQEGSRRRFDTEEESWCDDESGGWGAALRSRRKEPRAQDCGQPLGAETGKETDSPLEPPERTCPAHTVAGAQWNRLQTSVLQNK